MSTRPLPVVVAGSRFGQFYAAGLAASDAYRIAGILGQGSARTAALARRVGAPVFPEPGALPDDVRIACVAVGGAARGAQGAALACRLLERGIDVLIEHPLLPAEWDAVLRTAARSGRRCLLNSFYPHLPAVARFIDIAQRLRRIGPRCTSSSRARCRRASRRSTCSRARCKASGHGRSNPRNRCARRCANARWCLRKRPSRCACTTKWRPPTTDGCTCCSGSR
ncbi:oxidoreductase, NAD-binding Rossmann fold family protein [Burkholderia thailandensis]|uniref:Oxidoreductase, NAD-binding Rossmann fold family protein n=1 Tax=Burkholderia thailandensis TaxID=57975 RepID=A0AAW9CKT3_BURTH|nr:oxidoreductase, NAD-binding Rossmann fold family protein [Burkholderia thailandensis]